MVVDSHFIHSLQKEGWNLIEENIAEHIDGKPNLRSFKDIRQSILNCDLKDIGSACLPENVQKTKSTELKGPMVLQVMKVRNVSAPKAKEDSGAAPRMLRLTLTDGINSIQGLELQPIKGISLKTAPGTKVLLSSPLVIIGGILMLYSDNIQVIGGTVQELYEKWKLTDTVSAYGRLVRSTDGSGPPPWVPFGNNINKIKASSSKNFKSLKDTEVKDKDGEFENQRKQTVEELAKDANIKSFGVGKQMLDANVQKVVNAGFSIDVAEWALRKNRNDPSRAIRELKGTLPGAQNARETREETPPSGGRRGGRRKGGREQDKGPDGSDDERDRPNMPRPSGPASLFDFVDSKIVQKKEHVEFVEPTPRENNYRSDNRRSRGRGSYHNQNPHSRGKNNSGNDSGLDLTKCDWPAPGENKAPKPSNKSYMESRQQMDDKEDIYNSRTNSTNIIIEPRRPQPQQNYSTNSGKEYPTKLFYGSSKRGNDRGRGNSNPRQGYYEQKPYDSQQGYDNYGDSRDYQGKNSNDSRNYHKNNSLENYATSTQGSQGGGYQDRGQGAQGGGYQDRGGAQGGYQQDRGRGYSGYSRGGYNNDRQSYRNDYGNKRGQGEQGQGRNYSGQGQGTQGQGRNYSQNYSNPNSNFNNQFRNMSLNDKNGQYSRNGDYSNSGYYDSYQNHNSNGSYDYKRNNRGGGNRDYYY